MHAAYLVCYARFGLRTRRGLSRVAWFFSDLSIGVTLTRSVGTVQSHGAAGCLIPEVRNSFACRARPALQRRFPKGGEAVDAALHTLEPAIHIAQQYLAGIGRDRPKLLRPARCRPQQRGAGEGLLAVGGHHGLARRAARRRIAVAPRVFAEQSRAAALIRPRPVGSGLGEHLDPIARGVDGQQTETHQPAETVHARIPVTPAPGRRHGQPHLIRRAHAVYCLQQQIEVEAELHFHDRQLQRFSGLYRDDIAAVHFALHVEARGFQEALHGRVERRLGHAAQAAIPHRAAATVSGRRACE
jgi:hypothetical protein